MWVLQMCPQWNFTFSCFLCVSVCTTIGKSWRTTAQQNRSVMTLGTFVSRIPLPWSPCLHLRERVRESPNIDVKKLCIRLSGLWDSFEGADLSGSLSNQSRRLFGVWSRPAHQSQLIWLIRTFPLIINIQKGHLYPVQMGQDKCWGDDGRTDKQLKNRPTSPTGVSLSVITFSILLLTKSLKTSLYLNKIANMILSVLLLLSNWEAWQTVQ